MKTSNILVSSLFGAVTLFLSACGGSSSDTGASVVNHPTFSRKSVIDSPNYYPSGKISEQEALSLIFEWKPIENATNYRFGHENTDDASQWHFYQTTPSEANCLSMRDTCFYTPSDYTFPIGVEKVWWVQAKVGGEWKNWSKPIIFTIVTDVGSTVGVSTQISPSGVINSMKPTFSWSSVPEAVEYKLGYEDSDTAEGWTEVLISSTDAACASGQTCSSTLISSLPSKRVGWWVKAKNINGVWGDWSSGLSFTVDTSSVAIPNEPYQYFCNSIDTRPPLGNLDAGVIFNGKRYFLDPNNDKKIIVSNQDGSNEVIVDQIFAVKPRLSSLDGAVIFYISHAGNNQPASQVYYRVTKDAEIVEISSSNNWSSRARNFSHQNGHDIYVKSKSRPPMASLMHQDSTDANSSASAIVSWHAGQRYSWYYHNGALYYSFRYRSNPKEIGVLSNSFKLEKLGKCK